MLNITDEEAIRKYLLGDLGLDEQDEIQDRLFSDSEFLDRLLLIENELIHDYVVDNLPSDQRLQFEQFFLRSPDRQRRLRISRYLKESASRTEAVEVVNAARIRQTTYWRWLLLNPRIALTAVMIVLATALLWLLRDVQLVKKQIADLGVRQEQEQQANEALRQLALERADNQELKGQIQATKQEVNSLKARIDLGEKTQLTQSAVPRKQQKKPASSGEELIASAKPLELWPDQRRGAAGENKVRIESGATSVTLQLNLEEDAYQRYRIEVRNAENKRIWIKSNVRARQTASGKALLVKIPAHVFQPGDFVSMVRGVNAANRSVRVDSYQFRIER